MPSDIHRFPKKTRHTVPSQPFKDPEGTPSAEPERKLHPWIVYTVIWIIVWTFPFLDEMRNYMVFSWEYILDSWRGIFPFFFLFLLHHMTVNNLLHRHRIYIYATTVVIMLSIFGVLHYKYTLAKESHPPKWELRRAIKPNCPHWETDTDVQGVTAPMNADEYAAEPGPPDLDRDGATAQDGRFGPQPDRRGMQGMRGPQRGNRNGHPNGLPKPFVLDIVIAVLMMGFDLAIYLFFRNQQQQETAHKLKTIHYQYELEHLKSQISPHFLMNILNNIHGMVDINPAKAQAMIMELSKIMRYMLYEGAKPSTKLTHEIYFIRSYVELMKERYDHDKVSINMSLPEIGTDQILLPPLLFISIIENAFKHGVSYQSPSFVDIKLSVEGKNVRLECTNSIHRRAKSSERTGGVGLSNLKQRLQLLYDDDFILKIEDDNTNYHVTLVIPHGYETDKMHSNRR